MCYKCVLRKLNPFRRESKVVRGLTADEVQMMIKNQIETSREFIYLDIVTQSVMMNDGDPLKTFNELYKHFFGNNTYHNSTVIIKNYIDYLNQILLKDEDYLQATKGLKFTMTYNAQSFNVSISYNGKSLRNETMTYSDRALVSLVTLTSVLPALNFRNAVVEEQAVAN